MHPRRRSFASLRSLVLVAFIASPGIAGCSTTSLSSSALNDGGGTPAPSAGCAVAPQTGILRSNALTGMTIGSDGLSDYVTFQLGAALPGPTGSSGRLEAAGPPFVEGASGRPVSVVGSRFVELHFDGMLIADEAGNPTYLGDTSVKPDMLSLRQVEMTEAFEGVYNFVIGYRGNGCVGLAEDAAARTLTVTIGH